MKSILVFLTTLMLTLPGASAAADAPSSSKPNVLDAAGDPSIAEFQLFAPKRSGT